MKRSTATLLANCEKRPKLDEWPQSDVAAMKHLTLDLKRRSCLTDNSGQPWDDFFFHCWKHGFCCSQNVDFLGFTQLIAMRFPCVQHMDICPCKVTNTLRQWRSRNVGTFWFPIPGLCKKYWPQKTLFSGAANAGNFTSAAKTYTCPGSPVKWVDYSKGQTEAYRPLREDQVNSLIPCYDSNGSVMIQLAWEKDPLLDIYKVIPIDNKEEIIYELDPYDHVLYDDDGVIIGIWDRDENDVLEKRRLKDV